MNHWRALNPSLRGTLVLLLVGVLVVAGGWWYDGRDRVDTGPVESSAEVLGHRSSSVRFQIPDGTVDVEVEVGERTFDPDNASDDFEEIRAPRDGRLVQVSWVGNENPRQPESEPAPNHPRSTLALRAAGDTYDLGEGVDLLPYGSRGSVEDTRERRLIALPTSARDLVVELEFAGKKQSVDLATGRRTLGAFAPLYRSRSVAAVRTQVSEDGASGGLRWHTSWRPAVQRTPYLAGHGWAEPGREWVTLANTELTVGSIIARPEEGDQHEYQVKFSKDARAVLTIDDARVVRKPNETIAPGASVEVIYSAGEPVFDVVRGSALKITATVRAPLEPSPDDPEAPDRDEPLVVTRTASVDAEFEPGADR